MDRAETSGSLENEAAELWIVRNWVKQGLPVTDAPGAFSVSGLAIDMSVYDTWKRLQTDGPT
jgi:hypothetical protein